MTKTFNTPAEWSFIVACNNEKVLRSTLLRSPCLAAAREIIVERGHACAGTAYNAGMDKAGGEMLIFLHQDVFLPADWAEAFSRALALLAKTDPHWGVLGAFGVDREGHGAGHLYCTGLKRIVGRPFEHPLEVATLDELLLVLRRSSGLRFDEQLPGFHLYGTDICLQARQKKLRNYAVPAFCIHNSNGIRWLPWAFWKAARHIRRKWRHNLPIYSPCITITRTGLPVIRYFLNRFKNLYLKRNEPGKRCQNPEDLYQKVTRSER